MLDRPEKPHCIFHITPILMNGSLHIYAVWFERVALVIEGITYYRSRVEDQRIAGYHPPTLCDRILHEARLLVFDSHMLLV